MLLDYLRTDGVTPKPATVSNIANQLVFEIGDPEAGFTTADVIADVIVEHTYKTKPIH